VAPTGLPACRHPHEVVKGYGPFSSSPLRKAHHHCLVDSPLQQAPVMEALPPCSGAAPSARRHSPPSIRMVRKAWYRAIVLAKISSRQACLYHFESFHQHTNYWPSNSPAVDRRGLCVMEIKQIYQNRKGWLQGTVSPATSSKPKTWSGWRLVERAVF